MEILLNEKNTNLPKNEKRRNKVFGIHPKANYKVKQQSW